MSHPATPHHCLRISASQLRAGEAGLVRALVVLTSAAGGADASWEYVESGADVEAVEDPDGRGLVFQGPGGQSALIERPITAERLQAALLSWTSSEIAGRPVHQTPEPARPSGITGYYKLVKWPPVEVLRGDNLRVRIATLLTRNALSVDDLARLSGAAVEQCVPYLRSLQSLGLLRELPLATPSGRQASVSQHAMRERRTLVHRIRHRLGLVRGVA